MPSHQQNMHVSADGHKNMNASFKIMFAVHPICVKDSIFKTSSARPDYWKQNKNPAYKFRMWYFLQSAI